LISDWLSGEKRDCAGCWKNGLFKAAKTFAWQVNASLACKYSEHGHSGHGIIGYHNLESILVAIEMKEPSANADH
jgi:hypothetical protein